MFKETEQAVKMDAIYDIEKLSLELILYSLRNVSIVKQRNLTFQHCYIGKLLRFTGEAFSKSFRMLHVRYKMEDLDPVQFGQKCIRACLKMCIEDDALHITLACSFITESVSMIAQNQKCFKFVYMAWKCLIVILKKKLGTHPDELMNTWPAFKEYMWDTNERVCMRAHQASRSILDVLTEDFEIRQSTLQMVDDCYFVLREEIEQALTPEDREFLDSNDIPEDEREIFENLPTCGFCHQECEIYVHFCLKELLDRYSEDYNMMHLNLLEDPDEPVTKYGLYDIEKLSLEVILYYLRQVSIVEHHNITFLHAYVGIALRFTGEAFSKSFRMLHVRYKMEDLDPVQFGQKCIRTCLKMCKEAGALYTLLACSFITESVFMLAKNQKCFKFVYMAWKCLVVILSKKLGSEPDDLMGNWHIFKGYLQDVNTRVSKRRENRSILDVLTEDFEIRQETLQMVDDCYIELQEDIEQMLTPEDREFLEVNDIPDDARGNLEKLRVCNFCHQECVISIYFCLKEFLDSYSADYEIMQHV